MNGCLALAMALAALTAALASAARLPAPDAALLVAQPEQAAPNCSPFVDVVLYGEALCPDTAAFLNSSLVPLAQTPGFNRVLRFHYYAWGKASLTKSGAKCQHGPAECRLNRLINCAQRLYALHKGAPGQAQWLPYVSCLAQGSLAQAEARVPRCADEAGLNGRALQACAVGDLGAELERAAAAATARLRPRMTWLPHATVNAIYLGHDPSSCLKTTVCAAFTGYRPSACFDDDAGGGAKGPPAAVAIEA